MSAEMQRILELMKGRGVRLVYRRGVLCSSAFVEKVSYRGKARRILGKVNTHSANALMRRGLIEQVDVDYYPGAKSYEIYMREVYRLPRPEQRA